MKASVLLVVFVTMASIPMAAFPANKADLIDEISDETDIDREVVQEIVDSLLENMARRLAEGDNVLLVGFGRFTVGERAARAGRNSQTGATIAIPAARRVEFRAAETLKEAVSKETKPEDQAPN